MYIGHLQKLPYIIAGVFLLLGIVWIFLRAKNISRSEFVKLFKTANYLQAWVLITVLILTAVFGVLNHMHAKNSVQAILALNFSEASQAKNSNGTRYNPAEITCDEVLSMAIQLGALENVTVKQLAQCLTVYPYVQGDVRDKSEYHISTEFVVEYHASKHTQHLDAENVIQMIATAYKEYYIDAYTDDFVFDLESNPPDYSTMEYMDTVSYLDKEANSILNYLYGMQQKSSSFVTENNATFGSIAGKVYQFKEAQIEQNLKSLILQNGLTRDKVGYIDRLSYQNQNTDFDRLKNAVSFALCNQAIDMYAEEMTRVVLVPTWDEAGKYYMGRTKVGIDELSVKATQFSDAVASNEKEIMDNNLIIGKMQAQGASVSPAADEMIVLIDAGLRGFAKEAVSAGRAFLDYRMNQCIAVSIYGTSLFGELKSIALFAAFAYLSLMLYAISKKFPKKA